MSNSKNDKSWNKIFEKYLINEEINNKGFYEIKSSVINEFREARLMTKFDHRSQLPLIFVENQLSILPVSRGAYVISNFDTFKDFNNDDVEIQKVDFPNFIESIDFNNITSEATALNCAYVSGIINDFVEDEAIKPTVSGRMSSLNFDFTINAINNSSLHIEVNNSQIEIDGGYEGINSLNLIEAKNSISKDFLIRQLFYPFKLWQNKVTKKVRTHFLTYSNGIFHFREYLFEDPKHYNSLKLIREKKYTIREGAINIETIQKILFEIEIIAEPNNIPFPQADSFERVINLCELLNENETLSKDKITENYDFDSRQTDYYANAGRYLGLIDKDRKDGRVIYFLSKQGAELFNLSIADRQLKFINFILSYQVFNKTLRSYFEKGEAPDKREIVELMKTSNLYNIGTEATFDRRASTISGWVNWIFEQIEE